MSKFIKFINTHRRKDEEEITHTSMGCPKGSFHISKEDYPNFLKLYLEYIKKEI